jgi:hypothetical protein
MRKMTLIQPLVSGFRPSTSAPLSEKKEHETMNSTLPLRAIVIVGAILAGACGASNPGGPAASPPTGEPPTAAIASGAGPSASAPSAVALEPSGGAPAAAASKSPPIDENAVASATGGKPENSEGVIKVSFPRTDVPVDVDGSKLSPFLGLTSWAAFTPGKPGVEAMVMGDLVLFEDEVNPVMSTLFENGVEVTALHNHFFYAKPVVFFMHVNGEGTVAGLGKGVKAALEKVAEIRKKTPKPLDRSGGPPLPAKSAIDPAKLDAVFGLKGQAKDGMYKATMGRSATAACGCPIGKAMGVNTWAAFQGTDDNASVDGDFAVSEAELQTVLKALRGGGIQIVAIHSHMTGETPRILFLHYWGRGKATDLAATVKTAVGLTAWEGKGKST